MHPAVMEVMQSKKQCDLSKEMERLFLCTVFGT